MLTVVVLCVEPAHAQTGEIDEAGPARVAVLFGAKRSYRMAAHAVELVLGSKGYQCISIELSRGRDEAPRAQALKQLVDAKPAVIAAGGTTATVLALEALPEIPVIFFMVPNALDAPFLSGTSPHLARVGGVTSDISPSEQAEWLSRVHRNVRSVAILHSPRSRRTVEAIKAVVTARGIDCFAIEARKEEFPKAIEALNDTGCDGVLMVPDARVYNSPTVQRLLLWGVRQRKAVWAFSENLVKAGALAGQYPDAVQVGRQAGELIHEVIAGANPEKIGLQYPYSIGRAVNEHTAGRIGVSLNDWLIGDETVRYGDQ